MCYRQRHTQQVFDELARTGGLIETYTDFLDGSDYLQAVQDGKITDDDIVLMMSIDSAQLYHSKESDCWISIWKFVLPGVVIPGPKKAKVLDSFLFPGFHHLAAIQKEGLKIWDAAAIRLYTSYPFLALGTADGPGLAYLNGLVGHHGKNGCRLYCGLKGRHKHDASHYYPVLLKPDDYHVLDCDHPDIDVDEIKGASPEIYWNNLIYVLQSSNDAQYRQQRLETGISKPTIFLGFSSKQTLGVPKCFGSDIMHLLSLNIPDLLINLWRGTFECDPDDDKATWFWATLTGDTWKSLGKAVGETTHFLPGSFDRPPRNIAEKINSGYKAWEFWLFLYGVRPAVLFGRLPDHIGEHFCKLVYAVRLISQYRISRNELILANQLFHEWRKDFEVLYYLRMVTRIHFVRQCAHALDHYADEVFTKGPLICASQWTMERTIGNLVEEIRQPSSPYANLAQRAIRRAQVNALKSMMPCLDDSNDVTMLPRGANDLGNGYVLLRCQDRVARPTSVPEGCAVYNYIHSVHPDSPTLHAFASDGTVRIARWARTLWKETQMNARCSRNVREPRFGEVRYFFECRVNPASPPEALAVISLYSTPDLELLRRSHHTFVSCVHQEDKELIAINVTSIQSVVTMIPHSLNGQQHFYMVEWPGADVTYLGGYLEDNQAGGGEDDPNALA
ncbi:hypothetical protein P692DRAFT_20869003 [Suillus brevipes Sb2]|nr:hypothetical protein P692DRAFT_20869003 [Suillus brevipes Sb2]